MCPQVPRPGCQKQEALEKAQDFEEAVRLSGSKVAEEAEGRAELALPPPRCKNAACQVGAVLPGCSSHLIEETLQARQGLNSWKEKEARPPRAAPRAATGSGPQQQAGLAGRRLS